jgi:hypothetical protein
MSGDWSGTTLDDLWFHEALMPARASAAGSFSLGNSLELLSRLRLPALCLLTGLMAALLYGWPLLMLLELMDRGPRPSIFWAILGGGALILAVVAFVITTREQRYWAENWMNVSDWVTPPPWK